MSDVKPEHSAAAAEANAYVFRRLGLSVDSKDIAAIIAKHCGAVDNIPASLVAALRLKLAAAQTEITELKRDKERLKTALKDYLERCIECGGTGVGRNPDGEPYQCQWCDAGLSAISQKPT